MGSGFESEGFAFYLDELRRGSTDPYVAYRVFENDWQVPREDLALLRVATRRLVEIDPWFLATAPPHSLHALDLADLERLTPLVGTGPARKIAAMLRSILWCYGHGGPYTRHRKARARLRRALVFLHQVPRKQRDHAWHELRTDCYRAHDYEGYKRAVVGLLAATSPERRAPTLHDVLNLAATHKDWAAYDRFRRAWARLPPGHHACECYLNDLHTNDGLRAVAHRDWDAVPEALGQAGAVRGCAHLNSGGLRLDLVRVLIGRHRQLDAVRDYLQRAAAFDSDEKNVSELAAKLAITRAARR